MKFWQALLMNVAVVGAGLFAYDRMRCDAAAGDDDPLSDPAMERFETQYDELIARRGPSMGRKSRIAAYVERIRLSLDRGARRRLVDVLDGFQTDRLRFFERVPADAPDYDKQYRAFVDTWIAKVKALVPDAKEAAIVVERFVFDGRIIKKGAGPAEAGPGNKPGG